MTETGKDLSLLPDEKRAMAVGYIAQREVIWVYSIRNFKGK
jgi:hypothetical protein